MTLRERMKAGLLYREFGHPTKEEQEEEKLLDKQRVDCKELLYDYNQTRPREQKRRAELLKEIFGTVGVEPFIETPFHAAYGCNTHIGNHFYANFNLVLVDDGEIFIGDDVMIAPNVTISTTGHPIDPYYRSFGTQYSLPVKIGNTVWIGANVVILPGVTIGENSVIGAGSVVTHDIPANVVAVGNPCRVMREITERDKEYYFRERKVDDEFELYKTKAAR